MQFRMIPYWLLMFALAVFPAGGALAQTDKELREQRTAAHKELRERKKSRDQENADATRVFHELARDLDSTYKEKLRQVDVEYELRKVALQAEQDVRIAAAEADFQKQWSSALMSPDGQDIAQRMEQFEARTKDYTAELFRLKKDAAQIVHRERMRFEARKHDLLLEMDREALAQAEAAGLSRQHDPILATAIGGELTRQDEQWNERERKDVDKLHQRNGQTLAKCRNGDALRAWERANMDEDFRLEWEERTELQALESQRTVFGAFAQTPQSEPADVSALMARMADIAEQEKLIRIKYDQIRKENVIKRREERKRIGEG